MPQRNVDELGKDLLESARLGKAVVKSIKQLRLLERRGKISLESIGTTDFELGQLEVEAHLLEAKNQLKKIREGFLPIDTRILLLQEIHLAGVSLEDVGTSETEIDELVRSYYRREVDKILWRIRHSESNDRAYDQFVRLLSLAGVTEHDVDLSKVELRRVKAARKRVERLS